jgi:hypothetical protein
VFERVSVDNSKSGTHGLLVPTYLQGDYATVNTGYAQALIWNGMGQVDEIRSTLLQYGTFYRLRPCGRIDCCR